MKESTSAGNAHKQSEYEKATQYPEPVSVSETKSEPTKEKFTPITSKGLCEVVFTKGADSRERIRELNSRLAKWGNRS